MKKTDFEIMTSMLNISLAELWAKSYLLAKSRTPKQIPDESYTQFYRDLGISTLYEYSELIKMRADEMLRIAIDEDN